MKVILLKSPIGIFVLFCLILKPPEQNPNKFQPTSKQSHITSPPKKRSNKKNFPKSYRKKGVLFFLFPNFGVHNFPLDQTKTSTPNCCPTGSAIPETSPGATATADSSYGDGLDVSLATTGLGTSCDWEKRGSSTSQCIDSQGENSRWMDGWMEFSIKNWVGPYQWTPKEVARAIRYSGLGVRSVGPVGDFLEIWLGPRIFFSELQFDHEDLDLSTCVFLDGFFCWFRIPMGLIHHHLSPTIKGRIRVWTFSKHGRVASPRCTPVN